MIDGHPMQKKLPDDGMLRHMEQLVISGDWDCLKPYLRAAERTGVPETVMRARYLAGACVGCDRAPCRSCGARNPLWCEVCWGLILQNCPKGKVVSGLARIMQLMTNKDRKRTI